ncbi:MAG: hypothetical protein IMZ44_04805 [Planctomycetes bacterium]|nr:hypothetical protein [Planctomycetota bacterium]
MDPSDLPHEWRDLERRLAARGRPEPSAGLRPRVLAAVRRELAAHGGAGRLGAGPWWRRHEVWQYAGAAAAGVLLVLNLAMSASLGDDFSRPRAPNGADVAQAAAKIRELVPSITPDEALREAIALRAGSHLVMAPRPWPGFLSPRLLRQLEEGVPWLTQ